MLTSCCHSSHGTSGDMHNPDLERALRKWGRVFGEPKPAEWDESASEWGVSETSEVTGTVLQMIRVGMRYAKQARKLTAYGKASRGGLRPSWSPDPEAQRIEDAWLRLYRAEPLQAAALRAKYCLFGLTDKERAVAAGKYVNRRLSGRQFRVVLHWGRENMAKLLGMGSDVNDPAVHFVL